MPPQVVLVGLPGAGKSSVGAMLARQWQVPFADTDDLIEAGAGRLIGDIFATDGEGGFRSLELATILTALADFDGVLALGGGAVSTAGVRTALATAGVPVVWLTADREQLLVRIGATGHRPLLAGDPAARLAELERERAGWYEQVCTLRVATAGCSVAEVAELVRKGVRR